MATIKLNDGSGTAIPHEQAVAIWHVLNGDLEGDTKQQAFAEQIKELYLNWRNDDIPDSYYQRYKTAIDELCRYHRHYPAYVQGYSEQLQGKSKAYKE